MFSHTTMRYNNQTFCKTINWEVKDHGVCSKQTLRNEHRLSDGNKFLGVTKARRHPRDLQPAIVYMYFFFLSIRRLRSLYFIIAGLPSSKRARLGWQGRPRGIGFAVVLRRCPSVRSHRYNNHR